MVSSGCIDLTGLLERAAREIQIEGVASYFSGNTVYLDEGQDTNPHLDWNVVGQLIKLSGKSVIYLSPSQVIYDFRGSDYSKLSDMLPQDIETVYMLENYRSTPEIVEAGIFMAESDAKGMKAVRKSLNIPVVVKSYNNPNDEADGVALTTGRLIKEGVNPAEIAILGRTWTGLFPIMEHLRMYGIPYNAAKNGIDLYDRPEILGLLEYITLANNPKTDTGLEILINFPFSGIGNRSKYIMRGLGRLTWDHIIESLTNNMVRPQVKERSSQLLDIREYLMEVPEMNIPVDQQLNKVLEISGIQKYLYEQLDYESLAAIETVTKMASEFATLREFEVYLKEQTIKRNIVKGGVTIKTLHASKGEEYDSVILPGWSEGNLPLTGASTNSEQRLGFVGVTRAKNRLVISYNKSAPPSRFLAGFPAVYV